MNGTARSSPLIAVVGAGLVGARHAAAIAARGGLAAVVDPAEAGRTVARQHAASHFRDIETCLAATRLDGAVIATPNALHVSHALAFIDAGLPVLVEKPIAETTEAAAALTEAAEQAGIPILVGHHRRHNPLIEVAKTAIDTGRIGKIVTVDAKVWVYKPNSYFSAGWRTQPGAGPVFINLIHDVDLLRHLCGEIAGVRAVQSSRVRGHSVEDTAVALLEFASGALGTVSVSDTVAAPWSWELTAGENPHYPHIATGAYAIGGTEGALSVPDLTLYAHDGMPSWWNAMTVERLPAARADPLERQIDHFCEVIRGSVEPRVSGREGLATLAVVEAIKRAADTGRPQTVS